MKQSKRFMFLILLLASILAGSSGLDAGTPSTGSRLSDVKFTSETPDSIRYQIVSDLIRKTIRQKQYRRTRFAINIREVGGNAVFSHNPETPLKPASTLKVVTTAVALEKLGPDYRYNTVLTTDGEILDGILDGNLIIHGTADPVLSGFFDRDVISIVSGWADLLEDMGIHTITGSVFLDNSAFSDEDGRMLTRTQTVAMFDKADKSQLVQTVHTKTGKTYKQKIRLRRRSPRKLVQINLNNYLAERVNLELKSRKMIGSQPVVFDFEKSDSVVFHPLIVHQSDPLSELVKRTNKESDNFYADQLLRTMGYELLGSGSIDAGLRIVESFLVIRLGLAPEALTLADGSGLSHDNRLSPEVLVSVLEYMAMSPQNKTIFYESLSIPTVDGTLEKRIRHPLATQIRAKTGSITGVVTLSGYMNTTSGKELVFSIMCNGGSKRRLLSLEDEICRLLLNI